ncbi:MULTISPECIES: type VII secretion protein EccB [unclassified Nocardiopsis]|uniref:type VII secretion protein EccB n=1 Tax=Nocardiopsis TaxID=2013 RepID=UPI00387B1F41
MQSRRDRVQAHDFMMGRLGTAMLESDPNAVDAPLRRTRNTFYIGLALGAVLCVGFLVFGLIFPGGSTSWRQEGRLILVRDTGASYLYSQGVLRPVDNYTSARLIQGEGMAVSLVREASLEGVPRGGPVGIPAAPDSLPTGEIGTVWRLCALPSAEGDAPRTSLTLDDAEGMVVPPPEYAVPVVGPDGRRHLLWAGSRLELDVAGGAVEAMGYGTVPALPVSDSFLAAVPEGPGLTAPAVPGLGEVSGVAGLEARRVGTLFTVPAGNGASQDYLLTRDGLVPLTATEAALLLASPATREEAYAGAEPTAATLSAGEVQRLLAPDAEAGEVLAAGLPAVPPEAVPEGSGNPCLVVDPSGESSLALSPDSSITALPVQQVPGFSPGCPTPDLVGVPAGGGALVRAAPEAGRSDAPTYYLVTEDAAKFPLLDADTVTALGYTEEEAVTTPNSLLRLLPTGPMLHPALAAQPLTSPQDPAAQPCPGEAQEAV